MRVHGYHKDKKETGSKGSRFIEVKQRVFHHIDQGNLLETCKQCGVYIRKNCGKALCQRGLPGTRGPDHDHVVLPAAVTPKDHFTHS